MPLSKRFNRDYQPPALSTLDEVTFCINCVDQRTGLIGIFCFDDAVYQATGAHFAISPICMSVDALLDYLREQGFTVYSEDVLFTVRRARL